MKRLMAVAMGLALGVACSKVEGELRVDGQVVEVGKCHSLQRVGFDGVDIDLSTGATLRLFRVGESVDQVGYFDDPASDVGALLGDCATGKILDTNILHGSEQIPELEGTATLGCEAPIEIIGEITFKRCF